jgi:bacillolysin
MTWKTWTVLALALILGSTGIEAQRPQSPAQGRSGFQALAGATARAFRVPADMRLVAQGRLGRGGQIAAERYRQFFGDAEVLGGQLTVYRDDAGVGDAVIGAHYAGLTPSNAIRFTPDGAQNVAMGRRSDPGSAWSVDLMIDPGTARYFYRVESRSVDTRWFFWIDADTGAIVNEYDGLTTGSGTGVLGDTKNLTGLTTKSGSSYRMVSNDGRQTTYDAQNRQGLPGVLATDTDDNWISPGRTSPGQRALVDAQFYAHVTDNWYLNTKAFFDWQAHYPQGMVSSAHLGRNYNNAYWNGTQMAYGDGDGRSFIEFSGDLDVVGHELSHGVTEATSNLVYQNESGALNESFSDIMGTAIEFSTGSGNWTIGEDITPGTNGLRNMEIPGEDGDPSHYLDRYVGTSDNGGVHTNSGIINHWFYLLVNGGKNASPSRASATGVEGIGLDAAEDIVFLGFTALPASATFCSARTATLGAAGVVPGGYAANVAAAWDEVGVNEALCAGSGGGDPGSLTISNVASQKLKGTKFQITWTTDAPADSAVMFTCCGTYSNSTLVTSHKMQFSGSVGFNYEYYVKSTDAGGHSSTLGPFYHQN